MAYLLLIIGFALLIKGADFFVEGASSTAYRFNIPTVIVGLTIVALGTSLPEAAVSISASLAGSNELAISNVLGSNIFNTLVVVGCSALIAPFAVSKKVVKRDIGFNILVTGLLMVLMLNNKIGRGDGLLLLMLLAAYLYVLIRDALKNPTLDDEEKKLLTNDRAILYMVGGGVAIMLGGNFTVDAARTIAASLGMSETLIGLTVVSVGTSLPELVTSVVAARKGESGLSLGNAIGSNILNILFILGMSSMIHPLAVIGFNFVDVAILWVIAIGLFVLLWVKPKLTRSRGALLVAVYVAYLVYIIIR